MRSDQIRSDEMITVTIAPAENFKLDGAMRRVRRPMVDSISLRVRVAIDLRRFAWFQKEDPGQEKGDKSQRKRGTNWGRDN